MNFKKKTLKNGLRMVVVPIKDAPSVTVMSMVEAGSEYETKEKNGISHFLEHMFFKGTKNRPKSIDISKEFDGMGAEHNAFTSNEVTAFYGKSAPKNFEKILDIISDMYLNPTFPEADIEKEKGVIIEEINMYEDLPQRVVHEIFGELLHGDTPYGWTVLGPRENIRAMKREDFLNYRKAHYVTEKTMIVVAGDVNAEDAFKKIENKFKNISSGNVLNKKKFTEKQNKPELKIKYKETDQSHLVIGVRTFDLHDKRMPTLKVLSAILGGGMSSRLFQRMREELGICYYVRSSINDSSNHGDFTISAGVNKKRLDVAVKGILEEIKTLRDKAIARAELKKAKDYLIGRMYLNLESSDSLASFYGFQEITRSKIKTPKEIEKEIEAITAGDVKNLQLSAI
ncbi:MAG: Peptidase M16 domain protein [Parcubacteria group bacterium GW2011_GWF2_39_8b]|nr:MAG: Peptidase M16 domain protein [Parcubacteria group bacterium GW2011_GWF2_39_8b]